jgi:hypothetical protein
LRADLCRQDWHQAPNDEQNKTCRKLHTRKPQSAASARKDTWNVEKTVAGS